MQRPALQQPLTTTVCVIGGGMAGLNTALSLRERGIDCVVLEAQRVGSGASGISKGEIVAGVQVEGDDLVRVTGDFEIASEIERLTHVAQQALLDRIARFDMKCDLRKNGSVHVSLSEDGFDLAQSDVGGAVERVLDHQETQRVVGSPLAQWASFNADTCAANPLALTLGLSRAAEELGAQIFEQTKAHTLKPNTDGSWSVITSTGVSVVCEQVVLCGGPHLQKGLSQRLATATVPVFTWMVATEPLSATQQATINSGDLDTAPTMNNDLVALNYWRFTSDGRLLWGGLAHAFPLSLSFAEQQLRAQIEEHYPQLAGIGIKHAWGGTLAFARHRCPLVGRLDETGPWFATALGGHGIVPACMAGELIASGIAGEDERWKLLQDNLPPSFIFWPFSRLGAELVLQVFRGLDRLRLSGITLPFAPQKPW